MTRIPEFRGHYGIPGTLYLLQNQWRTERGACRLMNIVSPEFHPHHHRNTKPRSTDEAHVLRDTTHIA